MNLIGEPIYWGLIFFLVLGVSGIWAFVVRTFIPIVRYRSIFGASYLIQSSLFLLLAIGGVIIFLHVMYSTFITVQSNDQSIVLGYCWPRRSVSIPRTNLTNIKVELVGKGNRGQVVVTTKEGRRYTSTGSLKAEAYSWKAYLEVRDVSAK